MMIKHNLKNIIEEHVQCVQQQQYVSFKLVKFNKKKRMFPKMCVMSETWETIRLYFELNISAINSLFYLTYNIGP